MLTIQNTKNLPMDVLVSFAFSDINCTAALFSFSKSSLPSSFGEYFELESLDLFTLLESERLGDTERVLVLLLL